MKKIILFLLFLFNIVPFINKAGKLSFGTSINLMAQSFAGEYDVTVIYYPPSQIELPTTDDPPETIGGDPVPPPPPCNPLSDDVKTDKAHLDKSIGSSTGVKLAQDIFNNQLKDLFPKLGDHDWSTALPPNNQFGSYSLNSDGTFHSPDGHDVLSVTVTTEDITYLSPDFFNKPDIQLVGIIAEELFNQQDFWDHNTEDGKGGWISDPTWTNFGTYGEAMGAYFLYYLYGDWHQPDLANLYKKISDEKSPESCTPCAQDRGNFSIPLTGGPCPE